MASHGFTRRVDLVSSAISGYAWDVAHARHRGGGLAGVHRVALRPSASRRKTASTRQRGSNFAMTTSFALGLAAAAIGVVAGLWFCVGSALVSAKTLAELATSYWDYHAVHAQVVVEQSAQYAVGVPLLVIAFVLQVLAALWTAQDTVAFPVAAAQPFLFLALVVLLTWALSFAAYRMVLRVKGKRVHAILAQQAQGDA